ncbi:MAG: isoleucine--tRNA ligase, partial [Sphingomicrobium sp.]
LGYDFDVPLLEGEHVTEDAGTGFVHTAPGHGREDFDIWTANKRELEELGLNTTIPYTVDENGAFTEQAPGFTGKRVLTDTGEKGDANQAVIKALVDAGMLITRGRLKHQYPHSWRSKKPVIFRNTPQWFIAMDKPIADGATANADDTLRHRALKAIRETRWVPPQGENRITGMIESRPDWVISRQRAWGVPITVFVREKGDGAVEILDEARVNQCIAEAFAQEGADAWYRPGARERFLGELANEDWHKVDDILDVWFDSGCTHAFVLEDPQHFPSLAGIRRKRDGGTDTVMYLEGSDQHRGWFQSSLLESCGTRGRAPYDAVLTHGFTMDSKGMKMSKSLGNTVDPLKVMETYGADIIRLWALSVDFTEDHRIGDEILSGVADQYRKLRNTFRYLLGGLDGFSEAEKIDVAAMPELERYVLHLTAELDKTLRQAVADFDFNTYVRALTDFCNEDLSAFYFDIRKDILYCEVNAATGVQTDRRRANRTVLDILFHALVRWLAPVLVFTTEEVWGTRFPDAGSVHLLEWPEVPAVDADEAKWIELRELRTQVTEAIEPLRKDKVLGSSLEAEVTVPSHEDPELLAELFITSTVRRGDEVRVTKTHNAKCERCRRYMPDVDAESLLDGRCQAVLNG